MRYMKAAVFIGPGRITLQEKPVPPVGTGEARSRITTTTICGTDVHILKGEYPVEPGRIAGSAALAWNILPAALGNILGGFLFVVVPFWVCFGSKHSAMNEGEEGFPHV